MSHDNTAGAVATLTRFLVANERQDAEGMKACLSRSTLEAGGFSGPMPPEIKLRMGAPEAHVDRVIIPVDMDAPDAPPGTPFTQLRCIMVQEDGEWKFDLAASTEPQMQEMEEAMGAAMQELGSAMGEALGGALGAVGDAMSEAFGGPGSGTAAEPSEWLEADEAPRDEEFTPLPELTPLSKTTFGVSDQGGRTQARRVPAVCDASGLADQTGEDPAALVQRLDKLLWGDLESAMHAARKAVPKEAARLRSVRIEASAEWCERCLVLDGPDLVYRLDMRDDDGRYSRDDLKKIIPGVIAGLPESPDAYPEGRTAMPSRDWSPSPEYYKQVIAARLMRRISAMLAWPIALDADWDMLCSNDREAAAMCVWGLSRVVGALALAFPAGGENIPEAGWFSLIRLTSNLGMPSVTFENAELHLQISPTLGEKGCLYEHQIRDALLGRSH